MDPNVDLQGRSIDPETLERHPKWLPDLVQILLQNGMDPNSTFEFGRSTLHFSLGSFLFQWLVLFPEGHVIRKRFLSVLIEGGADVLHLCQFGSSAADYAWGHGHWEVWCETLQENGINVQEIDQSVPQGSWVGRV